MPAPVIEISRLNRSHRHEGSLFALHVPELLLYPSQTSVFSGPSGCGKSTLFDALGLIGKPDSAARFVVREVGEKATDVLSAGDSLLTLLRSRSIGYVLQHGGLISSLSVGENIMLPSRLAGLRPDRRRFHSLVERLGIGDQLKKKPARLSGGQQQRAAIARALINGPSIVLADEPTGQLDLIAARNVRDLLISTAREEAVSLLVVTHDPALFVGFTDRLFGFEMRFRQDGATSTLREQTPTAS